MRCECYDCKKIIYGMDIIALGYNYGTHFFCVDCYAKRKSISGWSEKLDEEKYKKILSELK